MVLTLWSSQYASPFIRPARTAGIEPAPTALETAVLPLNYVPEDSRRERKTRPPAHPPPPSPAAPPTRRPAPGDPQTRTRRPAAPHPETRRPVDPPAEASRPGPDGNQTLSGGTGRAGLARYTFDRGLRGGLAF